MIIGRWLTPLNSSRTMRVSAGVTTTRATKCKMSAGIAPEFVLKHRRLIRCRDQRDHMGWLLLADGHLHRRLFGDMLRRIWALPLPAGCLAIADRDHQPKRWRRREGMSANWRRDKTLQSAPAFVAS
jgi:hypothetical protein